MSYHKTVQKAANIVINKRKGRYVRAGGAPLVFNERELTYLYGALYKIQRIKNEMSEVPKAFDDAVDAYNYLALFVEMLAKRFPKEYEKFLEELQR